MSEGGATETGKTRVSGSGFHIIGIEWRLKIGENLIGL